MLHHVFDNSERALRIRIGIYFQKPAGFVQDPADFLLAFTFSPLCAILVTGRHHTGIRYTKATGKVCVWMKKQVISVTVISLAVLVVSGVMYALTDILPLLSVAVTFGTIFYHLAVRLIIGGLIDAKYHNHMDYTRNWFQERAFEENLYRALKVKKWKRWMPTFNPESFDLKDRSVEEIIQASCQAEVVHEIIMPLCLVPILFSIWFGSLSVFIITSCAAFLFDSIFVIMQRFNRPRLMRLLKRISK